MFLCLWAEGSVVFQNDLQYFWEIKEQAVAHVLRKSWTETLQILCWLSNVLLTSPSALSDPFSLHRSFRFAWPINQIFSWFGFEICFSFLSKILNIPHALFRSRSVQHQREKWFTLMDQIWTFSKSLTLLQMKEEALSGKWVLLSFNNWPDTVSTFQE